MRIFFGVILILLAVLTGGCSLLFSTWVFGDLAGDGSVMVLWLGGVLIAAASIWGAVALLRRPAAPSPARPEAPKPAPPEDRP